MKLKLAVSTLFLLISSVFGDEQKPFLRKVMDAGSIFQSIQTTEGNYIYFDGSTITNLRNLSDKRISQAELSFDIPDYAYAGINGINQTADGLVVVGYAQLSGYYGVASAMAIKYDPFNHIKWTQTISAGNGGNLDFHSATPTSDGGFVVTGGTSTTYHPVLIKFNSLGSVLWSKSFDNLSYSFRSAPSVDGGIILAADIPVTDGHSIGQNVVKVDGSGNLIWAVKLSMNEFSLHALTSLTNNRYLLAGKGNDRNKLLLIVLNEDGTIHSKTAYTLNIPDFYVSTMAKTKNGGVAIGGDVRNQSGSFYDGFIMKLDNRLQPIFQKRLGFRGQAESIASITAKEDGGFLMLGGSPSGTLIVGLDSAGNAPRCGFSNNFAVTKATFGNLTSSKLAVTQNNFALMLRGALGVKSKNLFKLVTNVCAE